MEHWIKNISESELQFLAPPLFVFSNDIETAASLMYREGMASPIASSESRKEAFERIQKELEARPPQKYWEAVKSEIRLLVCTNDAKYSELRNKLNIESAKGTNALVALISASIGSILGLEATLLVGFCAVALYAVVKIGKEAYCSLTNA